MSTPPRDALAAHRIFVGTIPPSGNTIVEPVTLAMLRKVAAAKPEVIVTFCTNFPAATVVADMEAELGLPIYDSTLLPLWQGLKLAGVDNRRGRAWGSLFEH